MIQAISAAPPAARPPAPATPDTAYTDVFHRTTGWSGADGAYSVPLGNNRTAWLFSDTLIGDVGADGRRANFAMARNSAAIQQGNDPATMQFLLAPLGQHFTPPDGRGWLWMYDAAPAALPGRQTVLLGQFETAGEPGVFDFRQIGNWMADASFDERGVTVSDYVRIPHFRAGDPTLAFGAAILVDGDWTYVYGTRDHRITKDLVVARVPTGRLRDFAAWTFYDGAAWSARVDDAHPIAGNVANELSVHRGHDGRFVLTTQDGGTGAGILQYDSDNPAGPWANRRSVYVAPEHGQNTMAYNAKAHPELSDERGLLISYNVNATTPEYLLQDGGAYRPRFIRLPNQATESTSAAG